MNNQTPSEGYDIQPAPPEVQPAPPEVQAAPPAKTSSGQSIWQPGAQAETARFPVTSASAEPTVQTSAVPPQQSPPQHTPPPGAVAANHQYSAAPPPTRSSAALVAGIAVLLFVVSGVVAYWQLSQEEAGVTSSVPTSIVYVQATAAPDSQPVAPTSEVVPVTDPTPAPSTPPAASIPATTPNQPETTIPGDLNLSVAMRKPPCNDGYIVITASVVTPGMYASEIQRELNEFVGSAYLRTDETCSSLRARTDAGNAIYSVFYGPFQTLSEACRIRSQVGGDSYVKVLNNTTPASEIQSC